MQMQSLSSYFFLKTIGRQLRWTSTFKEGDHVTVKRKITSEDVDKFIQLTGDHNPVHVTSKKPLVHGAFLNGLVSGIIGTKLPGFGAIVVEQTLKFPAPCYIGDEVLIFVELKSARKLQKVEYQVFALDENRKRCCLKGEALLYIPPKGST